jgi:8-oxo-dGTP diphosphatase
VATLVAGTAIIAHGRVLGARRAYPAAAAGRWELPGGKVHADETVSEAAVREVREELGCTIEVTGELEARSRIDDDLELVVVVARPVTGEPVPVEHDAVRWLAPEELPELDWLDSDRPFLGPLRSLLLDGEPMTGGNVGGAVRIGSTVRRPIGPWTPAVHALLDHLQRNGLAESPRVLGADELGREVLSYLPGRVLDIDVELPSEAALRDAMRWLRRYHDVVEGFGHDGPWRTSPAGSGLGRAGAGATLDQPDVLVCHHDLAPYNVALSSSADGERVVGVFDWDMAGPGTRIEDLGFAAWNWVPLYRQLPVSEAVRRLHSMADAYGVGVSAAEILSAVIPRIERSIRVISEGQRAGDRGMLNLATVGEPARTEAALNTLRARMPRLDEGVRASP